MKSVRAYLKNAHDQRIWYAGHDQGWKDFQAQELGAQTKTGHAVRIGITLVLLGFATLMAWEGGCAATLFFAFFEGAAGGETWRRLNMGPPGISI
jgi:hypothetical protein